MTGMLESDVKLKDGTSVHIRLIRPEDEQALIGLSVRLSPQSVYQRFFTALPELTRDMARSLSNVNYTDRLALVVEIGTELIGVARYERTSDPEVVELAMVLIDEWQNRGLGRVLLREIMRSAERNCIHRFRADVLAENRRMLRLLATEGSVYDRKTEAGVTSLYLTSRGTSTS
jgi:RimJ/RimL family protein N-acetyltransferase